MSWQKCVRKFPRDRLITWLVFRGEVNVVPHRSRSARRKLEMN
jgi:hypothetical protein